MGGSLQLPILEVLELVSLAALVACTVWLALRSMPAGLLARQKRVEEVAARVTVEVESIVAERATWKAQGERLAEEVSTYLDQIERKRSSTAAAASRLKANQELAAPPRVESMSRVDQIAHARRVMG